MGLGEHINACLIAGLAKALHQTLPRALGHGMHAVHRVTWVQKIVEHLPHQAMVGLQLIKGQRNVVGIGLHQHGVSQTFGLGLDVSTKTLCIVCNALCRLSQSACRWNEPRRQRR